MPFSQALLPEFDSEMKNTRKLLERVPDDKFEYRPHERSMTLARLATHTAELPSWASLTLDQDVLDLQPGFKPRIAVSRAELLEIFDKSVAEARKKIAATSDEMWETVWTLKFDGKTLMSMPRSTVIRSTVINHMIHHRAQLGVYLRLNEVEIPGMYGPSADEMKFWEVQNA